MLNNRFFKPFILLLLILLFLPVSVSPQNMSVKEQFYRTEIENWKEYIERYGECRIDSSFDVRFYDIGVDIRIDQPYITGRVHCDFEARQDGLSSIGLNFHHSLSIDSITGNADGFTFVNDTIYVDLDTVLSSGDPARVSVYYRGIPELAGGYKGLRYETHYGGQPIIATLSTPYLAHYWWPCKDGPGDKPDSVYIDIAIPDTTIGGYELFASSNGTLDDILVQGNKKIFRWRERHPIVTYYVMAAISNFRHYQQDYSGHFGESFPLDYYIFDESYDESVAGVEGLPEVMDLFSTLFGVYPFENEKYAMTQLGFYGGIENQTNTIIGQMSPSWFEVSVHELAHMWFGDMITCRDWHHGWLNEGFATYAEALWAEHIGGSSAYRLNMEDNEYYSGGSVYLEDVSDPYNGVFVGIIYRKGAYVLHMLRGIMGDSLFFQALDRYAGDPAFRYDHAVTEDFQGLCENLWGNDLDFFFDQWIYDEYYPMYEYSITQDPVTYETAMRLRQVQSRYGRRAVFEMPIQLEFHFQTANDTLITIWNDQEIQEYDFDLPDYLLSVTFDPGHWILRTVEFTGIEGDTPEKMPSAFALHQNYPNPFNPMTTILVEVPEGSSKEVKLRIYDLRGKLVKTLLDGLLPAGRHRVVWDGTDQYSAAAGSGVYISVLEAGTTREARKMLIVR